ncbi:MAG TPA: hypothetical protein VK194_04575, partial [Candidatus Deferrimicrobium sp.]|nr:hypothetical protein [Candidatus Deferrimicrobium sp.]
MTAEVTTAAEVMPRPGDPALLVADLTVRYPGRREPSVQGVGVTVAAGERVGVAGRTGAGKSTL